MADLFVEVQRQRSDPFPIPIGLDPLLLSTLLEQLHATEQNPPTVDLIGSGVGPDLLVSTSESALHVRETVIPALQLVTSLTEPLHVVDTPVAFPLPPPPTQPGWMAVAFWWDAVPSATSYILTLGTSAGASDYGAYPGITPTPTSGAPYYVALPPGTYYGRVQAVVGGVTGPPSSEIGPFFV